MFISLIKQLDPGYWWFVYCSSFAQGGVRASLWGVCPHRLEKHRHGQLSSPSAFFMLAAEALDLFCLLFRINADMLKSQML